MHWIALLPLEAERQPWGWRALQYTPRVAQVHEALLLETGGSARLWGGPQLLARRLLKPDGLTPLAHWAQGRNSLIALARLRLRAQGKPQPADVPGAFDLSLLDAALPHVALLERMGCRSWADLRALPRGGVARRFGAELLDALDTAWDQRPERYPWLSLPEVFDLKHELPSLATTAPELMWAAQRLLVQMQAWLVARQRGVLALEFEWTLDLKRLNGVMLPKTEQLVIRTARPAQDMAHLRRLAGEQLARAALAAPANHLRLRSIETAPWVGASTSLLPEDNVKGERLHQFIERVSVRLGDANVLVPVAGNDHRPERMQRWAPARQALTVKQDATQKPPNRQSPKSLNKPEPDALFPSWLLPEPQRLEVVRHTPQYGGPLRLLTRLWRVETAWWEEGDTSLRDYFIAQSESAGLVWIYRERPQPQTVPEGQDETPRDPRTPRTQRAPRTPDEGRHEAVHRWFLHGLYA